MFRIVSWIVDYGLAAAVIMAEYFLFGGQRFGPIGALVGVVLLCGILTARDEFFKLVMPKTILSRHKVQRQYQLNDLIYFLKSTVFMGGLSLLLALVGLIDSKLDLSNPRFWGLLIL